MWLLAAGKLTVGLYLSPLTGWTDLYLPSGNLLLDHVCKIVIALDCNDQCEDSCYVHYQCYYGRVVMIRLENIMA